MNVSVLFTNVDENCYRASPPKGQGHIVLFMLPYFFHKTFSPVGFMAAQNWASNLSTIHKKKMNNQLYHDQQHNVNNTDSSNNSKIPKLQTTKLISYGS